MVAKETVNGCVLPNDLNDSPITWLTSSNNALVAKETVNGCVLPNDLNDSHITNVHGSLKQNKNHYKNSWITFIRYIQSCKVFTICNSILIIWKRYLPEFIFCSII